MKPAATNAVRTALGLVALVALIGCGSTSDDAPQPGSGTAESRKLNVNNVPEDLRHLVPLAERWGIGDDDHRHAAVGRATPAEREELERAVTPADARITAWLDSFGQQPMPDEAGAFMYMLLALEEMRLGVR